MTFAQPQKKEDEPRIPRNVHFYLPHGVKGSKFDLCPPFHFSLMLHFFFFPDQKNIKSRYVREMGLFILKRKILFLFLPSYHISGQAEYQGGLPAWYYGLNDECERRKEGKI